MPDDPHPSTADMAYLPASQLLGRLEAGELSSVDLTRTLIERIEALDRPRPDAGSPARPPLRSLVAFDGEAVERAESADTERRNGTVRGPLHGLPVLVKDNIDTAGTLGTTAGSLALAGSGPRADATLVSALRASGALVFAKANLSEWANFRGRPSSSGWSGVGGQTRNPHVLDRSPGGSSSGSAAAVAAGLAPFAVGTETDGSILCPAAACGVVGLKPTVGLVSRAGIVPISMSQDTAGPIARTVEDAARLLDVLVTRAVDPGDGATGRHLPQGTYVAAAHRSPAGLRVGVVRGDGFTGYHAGADAAVETACAALRAAGVETVDPVELPVPDWNEDEMTVLCCEFRAGIAAYLARRFPDGGAGEAAGFRFRTVDDVIAFDERTPEERLDLFPQDVLVRSAGSPGLGDAGYLAARERNWQRTRTAIDAALDRYRVEALLAPTMGPAWVIDHVNGDAHSGAAWSQAAVAGYPSMTVPVGMLHGLPVGVALWGRQWSEGTLVTLGAALERQLGPGGPPSWLATVGPLA